MAVMPEVESLKMAFKFQDKENVLLNHTRLLWDKMENFDVTKTFNCRNFN